MNKNHVPIMVVQGKLLFPLLIKATSGAIVTWWEGQRAKHRNAKLLNVNIGFCQPLLSIVVIVILQKHDPEQLEAGRGPKWDLKCLTIIDS